MSEPKEGVTPKKDVKAKAGTSTAKVEQTIGAGAKALAKAVEGAEKVLTLVKQASQEAENITNEVATKKAELDSLTVEYAEKSRQALIDVDLQVKEKKAEAINQYLGQLNQVAVPSEEYTKLKDDKEKLEKDFQAEVATAANAGISKVKSDYEQLKKIDEANAKATAATQAAELVASKSQVAFYASQVDSLTKQIADERSARVEEAKARGNSQVIVNTTNK